MKKQVKKIINSPMKDFEYYVIQDKIYQLHFQKQADLCLTFLRFQEYYESPYFKDKIFTYEEFINWYAQYQSENKCFDYHTTWEGFNIPSKVLKPFKENKFDLSVREKSFLDFFSDMKEDFYIIGTFEGDDSALKHEIAHALFFTDKLYQKKVKTILKDCDLSAVEKILAESGYHSSVFLDECHAYLLCDSDYLQEEYNLDIKPFKNIIKQLELNYQKYRKN